MKKLKNILQKAEIQRKFSDDVRADLEEEITNLKGVIEQLTITNNVSSHFLRTSKYLRAFSVVSIRCNLEIFKFNY